MWTKRFWMDTGERVIATAAQAALAVWGVTSLIQQVDWRVVGGAAAGAAALALIKAMAASRKGDPQSASLVE